MSENINTDYKEAIGYLKTSPMFNLSLSSKELFHSNFLYWIYLYDKSYFKELAGKLGADTSSWGNDNDWVLKREYNNFDLCVIKYETQFGKRNKEKKNKKENLLLVIENKIKSIPTLEQLKNYNKKICDKFQNCEPEKILLSLTESEISVEGWRYVSYEPICEWLQVLLLKLDTQYERELINDYAKFVKALITLTEEWKEDAEDDNDIFLLDYTVRECKNEVDGQTDATPTVQLSNENPKKYQQARELRIHDLYGKYRTTILKEKLKGLIDSKRFKTKLDITPQIAYSNSLPILEIMIKGIGENKNGVKKMEAEAFFISIQGNQYRHAINARDKGNSIKEKRVNESVTKCKTTTDWHWFMNPNKSPNENGCFSDKLSRSGQRNYYCSFAGIGGVNYIYQYKKISPTATVEEILDIMVADVENIIEKFNK